MSIDKFPVMDEWQPTVHRNGEKSVYLGFGNKRSVDQTCSALVHVTLSLEGASKLMSMIASALRSKSLVPESSAPHKYWIVTQWGRRAWGARGEVYSDQDEANIEASRLASRYPGTRYAVLAAVGSIVVELPPSDAVVPVTP